MRNKEVNVGSLYRLCRMHHPPQTQAIGGARDAAQPHQAMARLCNFRLTRWILSGVGGRGWTCLRADATIVDATQRNARLPCWVGGGQRRSEEEVGGGRSLAGEVGDGFLNP